MSSKTATPSLKEILSAERGAHMTRRARTIALGYPSTYRVGASSLGFQWIYRLWNSSENVGCERFFTDSTAKGGEPVTLENRVPIGSQDIIAFSVACETDLGGVVALLDAAGIPPLASMRDGHHPPVLLGGPLTLVDPRIIGPLADAVVCGEAEDAAGPMLEAISLGTPKPDLLARLKTIGLGIWIPGDGEPPKTHRVGRDRLPAVGSTWSPHAELGNLFLVEIARGCPHRCAFCVLSNTGKYRAVDPDLVLAAIPAEAPGVGLVGAAVTDHPKLEEIVERIVASGKRVSLSSIRADRLTPELLRSLARGGLRSLTVAADGSSQSIRNEIKKGITERNLVDAARMAKEVGLSRLKVYSMIGLPGETSSDVEEFSALVLELSRIMKVSVAIQAFVPKPGTPLQETEMLDLKELKSRLDLFRRRVNRRITVQPTSPRWSWVDWKLCRGGANSALAAIDAHREGGTYSAWKKAIGRHIG